MLRRLLKGRHLRLRPCQDNGCHVSSSALLIFLLVLLVSNAAALLVECYAYGNAGLSLTRTSQVAVHSIAPHAPATLSMSTRSQNTVVPSRTREGACSLAPLVKLQCNAAFVV